MTRQVTEPFVQEAFGQYSCGAHFWLSRLAPTYKAPGWLVVTRCLWRKQVVDWWYKTGCLQHVFSSHEKSRDVERERERERKHIVRPT